MINLAILGTGGMAHAHAGEFGKIRGCKIVAACDTDKKRVKEFGKKFAIPDTYTDLDEMLGNEKIDAVANVTPDKVHCPTSLKIIKAGKHILCEKPLAVNYKDAKKMANAANKAGVINMVNFSYRNSSAIHKAKELIDAGEIGEIMHIEAAYLQAWLTNPMWKKRDAALWRLSGKHGSKGTLGDIGVHIVDFAGYPVGDYSKIFCKLKTFPKVKGEKIGPYEFDVNDSALITAEFQNGALATIHTTRWAFGQQNTVRLLISGKKGSIRINLDESYQELHIATAKASKKVEWFDTHPYKRVKARKTPNMYERFIKSIKTGVNDQPDFNRGAAVQKVLDACFESDKKGKFVSV